MNTPRFDFQKFQSYLKVLAPPTFTKTAALKYNPEPIEQENSYESVRVKTFWKNIAQNWKTNW